MLKVQRCKFFRFDHRIVQILIMYKLNFQSNRRLLKEDLSYLSKLFSTPRPKVPEQETETYSEDTDLKHLTMEQFKSEFITACVEMTNQIHHVAR